MIGNHPLPALPTYSITCYSANRTKQLFSSIIRLMPGLRQSWPFIRSPKYGDKLTSDAHYICRSKSSTECGEIPSSSNPGIAGEATVSTCISST
jgi:hypothetical protein